MLEYKEFEKGMIAINCRTVEEALTFRDWLHNHGVKWVSGKGLFEYQNLKWRDSDTCYRIDSRYLSDDLGLVIGDVEDYVGPDSIIKGVTVVPYNNYFGVKIDTADLVAVLTSED